MDTFVCTGCNTFVTGDIMVMARHIEKCNHEYLVKLMAVNNSLAEPLDDGAIDEDDYDDFGPVLNPDGSPTAFTLGMFGR